MKRTKGILMTLFCLGLLAGCAGATKEAKEQTPAAAEDTQSQSVEETADSDQEVKDSTATDTDETADDVTDKTTDEAADADTENSLAGTGVFTPVERKPLENLEKTGENSFTCSFEGIQHDFILDLPEVTEGAPLIVMLHGYGQSAEMMRGNVHMEETALPKGYGVVYVTGATDSSDSTSSTCWNSEVSENQNNDVGFLVSLVEHLKTEYGFDGEKVFAAGFSNGAFMMHRLAMDAQDVFCAVASVCGKMPQKLWDRRNGENTVGVLQISGEKDDLIPKNLDGSAKHALDPAIEDVMQYWAQSNGIESSTEEPIGKNSTIVKYEDGGRCVWSVMVMGGHHSWYEESLTGIDVNGLILEFFEAQK